MKEYFKSYFKSYLELIIFLAAFALMIGFAVSLFSPRAPRIFGETTINTFNASTTTDTSVSCGNNTGTLVLAAASSRNYLLVTVGSSTAVTLCFSGASSCTQSNGAILNGSGGSYELKYDNRYVGPVSCLGNGATSTIGIIYNQ